MIKNWVISVFCLLLLTSCKEKNNTVLSHYDNGIVKSELSKDDDDNYDGVCRWFYEDGTLQQECTYKQNLLEGKLLRYSENGLLQEDLYYESNLLQGEAKYYDFKGNKVKVEYYVNDTLHGPFNFYFPNGQLKVSGQNNNGLFDGKWTYYNNQGKIIGEGEFSMGTGVLKGYDDDGNLTRTVEYMNNKKHGKEQMFDAKGNLVEVRTYKDGFLLE